MILRYNNLILTEASLLNLNYIHMKKIYTIFIASIASFVLFATHYATEALTVSPAKIEVSGDPGSSLTGTIKLFNESNRAQTFYTSFENFEPSDDTGAPRFIGAEDGLATWLTTTPSISLNPQERVEVPFTINIPENIDPGGYFSAIFFGTQPPAPEGGVIAIGGRIGVLTLLRVNGDISEEAGVLDYGTRESRRFYSLPPVDFEYRFSNNGGDRVIPRGDIEVKNTFGKVRSVIDANPTEGNVLPSSARRFYVTWGAEISSSQNFFQTASAQLRNFHFGYYTATMNLGWGFTNQVSDSSVSFFMIPWQLLIIIITLASLLVISVKIGGRAYKKSLLRQLEKEKQSAPIETEK